MSQLTKSEALFEQHCNTRQVAFRRIIAGSGKTADYDVGLGAAIAYAEIKQLDPTPRDLQTESQVQSGTCEGVGAPTRRVRDQIAKAYSQLKPYAGSPCLVVLYNNSGFLNYIDDFTVTTAMFGTFGVRLGLDQQQVIQHVGQGFGAGRKLTRNTCRGISAVCVISETSAGTSLAAYHNPFANAPLDPIGLRQLADQQFRHDSPHQGRFVMLMPDEIKL